MSEISIFGVVFFYFGEELLDLIFVSFVIFEFFPKLGEFVAQVVAVPGEEFVDVADDEDQVVDKHVFLVEVLANLVVAMVVLLAENHLIELLYVVLLG